MAAGGAAGTAAAAGPAMKVDLEKAAALENERLAGAAKTRPPAEPAAAAAAVGEVGDENTDGGSSNDT